MIDYRIGAGVARITFNRPEADNRINFRMMTDFIDAIESAGAAGANVLVIDGAGEHFTRGRDQGEKPPPEVGRRGSLRLILLANAALRAFPGVSIALVHGRAMGFGSGVALHATIAVGADDAVLGFDEIRHDLAPLVVVAYLAHYVPRKIAAELVVTGRDVPAREAKDLGLLNRVVPRSQLVAAGEALVAEIGALHPSALRLIRAFDREVSPYPDEATGAAAVDRLAAWLDAGRP